jgi:hypothetical protein
MMADEATVIEAVQRLLRETGLSDRSQLLVGRWIEDGLPSEPVDGPAGRDQLHHAVGLILELSADAQAVAVLGRTFADRPVVFSATSRELGDNQRTIAHPLLLGDSQVALDWGDRLRTVADTLQSFLTENDDRR